MKTYGNEKTHLTLTAKAHEYYDTTDPIHIYETGENEYTVEDCGEVREGLTEDEVNELLEERYDNTFCAEAMSTREKKDMALELYGASSAHKDEWGEEDVDNMMECGLTEEDARDVFNYIMDLYDGKEIY